jgi:glycosyltransferase involved in cell wall biosynthesis
MQNKELFIVHCSLIMRIGIEATSAVEIQKAGVGYYTYHLIRAMTLLRRAEHTYTFYLRRPWVEPSPLSTTGTAQSPKFVSKVLSFPSLWAQIRLPIELWTHPQDVYFFPSPVIPLLYLPANSVVTVHDVAFLFFTECFSPMLRRWLTIATKRGVSKARKIIAVSESTKRDLITHYGASAEKIVVVHHGVHEMYKPLHDEENGRKNIAAVQQKYHLEERYILCLGTLQKRKNIPRLLQAFASLKHHDQIPHKLVLVGPKYPDLPEQEIFATIARLDFQQEVIWTGYVAEQDKPALLSGADLFVFPSLYEGFGMSLLEAMACGVPVACSNTSSFPEVVGESGLMFDPYNVDNLAATIYQALTDDELRRRLRQQGLQRAKTFSWETCARKTLDVLEEVGNLTLNPLSDGRGGERG